MPTAHAAAHHRVSTFPGAEEGGWQLINKTGAPQELYRLLERSLVSSQFPLLPQDSREDRETGHHCHCVFHRPAVRRVPTVNSYCVTQAWHSSSPSHLPNEMSLFFAPYRDTEMLQGFCGKSLGQEQSAHTGLISLGSGTPSFQGSSTPCCTAQDPHIWYVDQQRTHLSMFIISKARLWPYRQLCLTHSFPFLLTACESQPCQASGLAGFLPKHYLDPLHLLGCRTQPSSHQGPHIPLPWVV